MTWHIVCPLGGKWRTLAHCKGCKSKCWVYRAVVES